MSAPESALLIVNGSAGWDKKTEVPALTRQILQKRGIGCTVKKVEAGTDIGSIAADAVRAGVGYVIAGGGDGTLRAVAQALAGTDATLGVLPVGTLNHFARDLDIPLDIHDAVEVAGAGVPAEVDVGEVNGRVFINNVVLGLYPIYRFERNARELGGWSRLAMVMGALGILWRYPVVTARLSVEGRERNYRSPLIAICNNEHAMQGSKPWQRQTLREGKLWIYVLRDRSRWGMARVLANILFGRFKSRDEFDVLRAAEVTIETRGRSVGVSIDGEVVKMSPPLIFRSRPRALRVMVPEGSSKVDA
ncbi:MAG: hypothetical protein IT168_16965 [Bryobacterales bacterium]|nr:hypothetical protein [Bryobacterales bacterium]